MHPDNIGLYLDFSFISFPFPVPIPIPSLRTHISNYVRLMSISILSLLFVIYLPIPHSIRHPRAITL
jgi:hypothetical protein